MHEGQPLFFKSYGYHTYDSLIPVSTSHLYDLASVTKILASTLALMKLYEDGLIHLDDPIGKYVTGFGWSKVGKVTIRECLTHQSGLQSWIRFYERFQKPNGQFRRHTLAYKPDPEFQYEVAPNLYLYNKVYPKLKRLIRKCDFDPQRGYVYSDLFFYLVPELIQNVTGVGLEAYLKQHFYDPMHLHTLAFNPLLQFEASMIVPTEVDTFFRMSLIHGKVHDEGAILMKGTSGNAGLFGSAADVAAVLQMWLQGGVYGGERYLKTATVDLFTTYQYPNRGNRRALGFDKPLLEYDFALSSVAQSASHRSFGHTGFTGTLVWADPAHNLIYIFLSNRVYPTRVNPRIYQLNVRPGIHQILYDYLLESSPYD